MKKSLKALKREALELMREHKYKLVNCKRCNQNHYARLETAVKRSAPGFRSVPVRKDLLISAIRDVETCFRVEAERFSELGILREKILALQSSECEALSLPHFHSKHRKDKTMSDYLSWGLLFSKEKDNSIAHRLNTLTRVLRVSNRFVSNYKRKKYAEKEQYMRNSVNRTLIALATGNTLKDEIGEDAPDNLKEAVASLDKKTKGSTNEALVLVLEERKRARESSVQNVKDLKEQIKQLENRIEAQKEWDEELELRFTYGKKTENYIPMLEHIKHQYDLARCCGEAEYDRLSEIPKSWREDEFK